MANEDAGSEGIAMKEVFEVVGRLEGSPDSTITFDAIHPTIEAARERAAQLSHKCTYEIIWRTEEVVEAGRGKR